ncbi:(deoxy)nucleoside triphosphate pyrophosphohydrolase [Cohnella zeiphila]|uniref:8-oxo-dGTP diphosphatase n=1 Tax=Cohnella zeiphila TaxID=2761120 RepID=A0A7X0VU62_9BACL|nr:(deoxy)nucleoside triphosphate pyrophosphohydrolase [Cohnella zeiphila]MBB6730689.1 (deoxy)nucleoside triphosphate pyrophosphohydrolase [Cohnella zeiphila]
MIEVAAAIIENDQGKILIARRGPGKPQARLWEFPGGKLEAGESAADCLRRELAEEMAIEIEPTEWFGVNEHDYGTFRIRLIAYRAAFAGGEVRLSDHDEYRWAAKRELDQYEWAPADVPFVRKLLAEGSMTSP